VLSKDYLKGIKIFYEGYFDIEENINLLGQNFDLYGLYLQKNEKYFAAKGIKIWSYEDHEHILLKINNTIREEELPYQKDFFNKAINKLVKPDTEHRQSYLTYIEISEKGFSENLLDKVSNYKYSRTFAFGFKGFCDVRLVFVDLAQEEVYCNKKGDEIKNFYTPTRIKEIMSTQM